MKDFGESTSQPELYPVKNELFLSPEEQQRADADIKTLSSLRDYAQKQGYSFVLSAGYAVDAHRGGKITRSHGDMDVLFFLPDTLDRMQVQEKISELLGQEKTEWRSHTLSDDYLEYREEDETKSVQDKRVLEVDFFSEEEKVNTTQGFLMDSQGSEHPFEVSDVNSLVVGKVTILNSLGPMTREERQKEGYRELEDHDREDFYTLTNNSAFNKDGVIRGLTTYAPSEFNDDDALAFAHGQWENALRLIEAQTR